MEVKKIFERTDIKSFIQMCKNIMVVDDKISIDTQNLKITADCELINENTVISICFRLNFMIITYNHKTNKWLKDRYI